METETEVLEAPPGSAINRMGDRFRSAMGATNGKDAPAPSTVAPESATSAAPESAQPAANGEAPPPKTARDWKTFKETRDKAIAEAKLYKAERDAFEKKLKQVEEMGLSEEAVSEMKSRLAGAEDIVQRYFIGEHPRFKEHYGNRTAAATVAAKESATEHATEIDEIFALPPGKNREERVETLASYLSEVERINFIAAYRDLKTIEKEKSDELGKAGENLKLLQAQQLKQQEAATLDVMRRREIMLGHISSRIDAELEGADKDLITQEKGRVRAFLNSQLGADDYANVLIDSARTRKLELAVAERDEKIAKLETQVFELTSATPPVHGTGGAPMIRGPQGDPALTSGKAAGAKFRSELNKRVAAGQR